MGNRHPSHRHRQSVISGPIPVLPQSPLSAADLNYRVLPARHRRRRYFHLHSLRKGGLLPEGPIEGHGYGVIANDDDRTVYPPKPFQIGGREIHIQITFFEFLTINDLCHLAQVNCYFYREASQDKLWLKLLKRDYPALITRRYGKHLKAVKALGSDEKEVTERRPSTLVASARASVNASPRPQSGRKTPHDKFHPSHADLLLQMVGDHGAPTLRRSSSALAGPVFEIGVSPIPRGSVIFNHPPLPMGFATMPHHSPPLATSRSVLVTSTSGSSAAPSGFGMDSLRAPVPQAGVPSLNLSSLSLAPTASSATLMPPAANNIHLTMPHGALSHRTSVDMHSVRQQQNHHNRMRSRSQSSTDAELHSVTVHDPYLIWKEEQKDAMSQVEHCEEWDSGKKPCKYMYEDELRHHYDSCLLSPEALVHYLKSSPDIMKGITDMCKSPAPGSAMEHATRGLRQSWPDVELSVKENWDYLRMFYFAWRGMKVLNRRIQLLCNLDRMHGLQSYTLTLDDDGNPIFVFTIFSHADARQFFRTLLRNESLVDLMGSPQYLKLSTVVDANPHKK